MNVVVGRVGRPHGLTGEVTVLVRTDSPEQRFAPGTEYRLADGRLLTVRATRWHRGALLVRLDGVTDRDAAESLRGAVLTVPADDLPPLDDPDEFHDHELVGLHAVLADGQPVGTVREVVHGPAGELLSVAREGRPDALVPFVRDIVPTVNLTEGKLVLTPPEGLLD
ncbi:ribosome maturation factor RimM [Pseudonocardia acaciae]|uniref:ribosome maturation factor RimM n=1 Tax=Pseudonocardia acaciae TaxID=551276 RepID=UPI00048A5503|nr:ribosome maturation factor RimM [Pseudonocardia acaciae]